MSIPTAIQDRSTITVSMAKTHMRVDGTVEDAIIRLYLSAAKARADAYCNNTFTDQLGNELDIPADVDVWVLQTVSKFYNHRTVGVSMEKVEDLGEVKYHTLSDVDINFDLLKPYRHEVGFGGIFIS
jgi:hypothetical protein